MKKPLLLFLYFAAAFIVKAQDTKPTKEQTVNFLKQKFLEKKIHHQWRYEEAGTNWDAIYFDYQFTKVDFNECSLQIEYTKQRIQQSSYAASVEDQPKLTELEIHFDKIESVSFSSSLYKSTRSKGEHMVVMVFKEQTNDGKIKEIDLPFIALDESSYLEYEKMEDQIYKAFNHLRKLCGAAEPIKF